jgi:hypothetical protein
MAKRKRHPVWDVYDEYRTALYNEKAHTTRIHQIVKISKAIDIALAVFTPSSAITGLFLLHTSAGKIAWNSLISVASLLAVSKPFLKLDIQRAQLIASLSGYTQLRHDLEGLTMRIRRRGKFDDALEAEFESIRRKKVSVYKRTTLFKLSKKKREELYNEVIRQHPMNRFFVPED